MVFTVTMNSRQQQIRKHGNSGSSIAGGYPANKRPRVGSSPANNKQGTSKGYRLGSGYDSGVNTTSSQNNNDDLFCDDDIFTGDTLAELEMVASQAENNARQKSLELKQNGLSHIKDDSFKHTNSDAFRRPNNVQRKASIKTNTNHSKDLTKELLELQQQCTQYESKLQKLEEQSMQSSGEASLLRDKLRKAEHMLLEERQLKSDEASRQKDEKSKKEIELAKKVEVFKDQMEFKQAELHEAQELIRNLEAKNKMLVEETQSNPGKKEGLFSTQRLSQSDEFSHKKIKFVKPESPRIASHKHKIKNEQSVKVVTSKSPSSSQETKPPSSSTKRRFCRLLPQKKSSNNSANHYPQVLDALHNLLMECKRINMFCVKSFQEKQLITDAIEATENIISHIEEKTCNEQVTQILPLLVSTINHHLSTHEKVNAITCAQQAVKKIDIDVALNALVSLMKTHENLKSNLHEQDMDIIISATTYLSTNPHPCSSNPVVKLFELLLHLSKPGIEPFSKQLLNRFLKMVEIFPQYIEEPNIKYTVLNIAMNFIGSVDIIEKLASSTEGQGESFLLKLCATTAEESSNIDCSIAFLTKVVAFLSELTCKHEDILTKQGCFAEIYHTLNVILYHQLLAWQEENTQSLPRDRLLSQCVCLLHSCSNIFVEGIPGVARDHRHPLVLWKLHQFLEKRNEQSFWLSELRKIVKTEINNFEVQAT